MLTFFSGWNWKARAGAAITALVVLGSAVSALVNGVENVRDVFAWAIWAWERLSTPWLGLFILILAGWLLWSGLKDMRKAIEQGNAKDREFAEKDAAARKAAIDEVMARLDPHFAFIDDLKRLAVEECRLNELERQLFFGDARIKECERFIKSLPKMAFDGTPNTAVFDFAKEALSLNGNAIGLDNPIPDFPALPIRASRPMEDSPGGPRLYDVANNQHYEAQLHHRLVILERGRQNLKAMVDDAKDRQGRILQKIGFQIAIR